MRKKLAWGIAVTAMTVTVGVAPAGAAAREADRGPGDRGPARVTGSAEFVLPFAPDDDVRSFTFDARAVPYSRPLPIKGLEKGSPADAAGTVRISHWVAADKIMVRAEAAVDCMITSPGHATLTAVVTRADEEAADFLGKRVGFSVQDGGRGRDRVGFSWSVSVDQDETGQWGEARVGTCLAPAAFGTVTRGDYTVRHAELPAPPAGS